MRAIPFLLASAIMLGGAGGYAWSMLSGAPAKQAPPREAKMVAVAPSPEELPEEADRQWTAEADDGLHYAGCNEVRAAGKAPLLAGEPGYRADMDGDGDGIACEPIGG
jgi:hypothetical protein